MKKPVPVEREAVNWIIRNNLEIQYLLEEDNLKQVLIMAYQAGKQTVLYTEEDFLEEVDSRLQDEMATRYDKILVSKI